MGRRVGPGGAPGGRDLVLVGTSGPHRGRDGDRVRVGAWVAPWQRSQGAAHVDVRACAPNGETATGARERLQRWTVNSP